MGLSSIFNLSFLSSALMVVYVGFAVFNIYRLMNPLSGVDLDSFGTYVWRLSPRVDSMCRYIP